MKFACSVLLLALGSVNGVVYSSTRAGFEMFKLQYKRQYASGEEDYRFNLFKAEVEKIKKLNKINGSPVFGVTQMADRAPHEKYKRGRKGHADLSSLDTPVHSPITEVVPAAIDWRDHGAVTPVKNQGQCGSCWAFSAAETVESAYILAGNPVQELSPQQINSCVTAPGNDGCGGGDTVEAFKYLANVTGLANRYYWPYTQGMIPSESCLERNCTAACNKNLTNLVTESFYIGPNVAVKGFNYATPPCLGDCEKQNLRALASTLVERGPVSICVNSAAWDSYVGGVLSSKACGSMAFSELDHCVQLVGFNSSGTNPYWIVRNSWGTTWGLDGYIHLQYTENTCGMADEAAVVTVN